MRSFEHAKERNATMHDKSTSPEAGAAIGEPRSPLIADQIDLPRQIRRVLSEPGPLVCEVRVVPDEIRAPRLSTVQRPDGSLVSKPLEDLWPFLDREEFASNMLIERLRD